MRIILLVFLLISLNIVAGFAQKRNLEKFKPEKDMVSLGGIEGKVALKVGQKAYFQYTLHGSVGTYSEWDISNEAILKKVDEHIAYESPHEEGMTGNDRATVTIVFEALKAGNVVINTRKMFRGEVKSKLDIKIKVE